MLFGTAAIVMIVVMRQMVSMTSTVTQGMIQMMMTSGIELSFFISKVFNMNIITADFIDYKKSWT
jgi:hypothetical protein